jgi:esterase/lipase
MEKHIILLHGALGSKSQLEPLEKQLTAFTQVHSFNLMGHGGISIPENMVMEGFVWQLENYIQQNIPGEAHLTIFGYSMGGYAALVLATMNTCKIDTIVTLGTKLLWDPEIAAKELTMLDASIIEEKLPDFARELKQRHQPQDWKLLLRQTAAMMIDLGEKKYLTEEAFTKIIAKTKLMIGDKDKMVSLEETVHAFKKINGASLAVLPTTPHPIEKVNLERLAFELENF